MWDLWVRTARRNIYRGMDGDPVARDLQQVRHEADALGVPWNARTLERFEILEAAWQAELDVEREKRAKEYESGRRGGAKTPPLAEQPRGSRTRRG